MKMKVLPGPVLADVEIDRESSCRTLHCPNCEAIPRRLCAYGFHPSGRIRRAVTSHTGRYLMAVAAGLVPPMPGGWPYGRADS